MELFHGSNNPALTSIKDYGTVFDGLFCTTHKEVAESHGTFIYKMDIEEEKILRNMKLNYEIEYKIVKSIFSDVTGIGEGHPEFDAAWEAVIEDRGEVGQTVFSEDPGESSWAAQRLRGHIARKLGYDAVDMKDEHGITSLVLNAPNLEKSN